MSSFQHQHPAAIGRYRIVRPIGSGAMGDVYLAVDPHIDRQLAIKTVRVIGANAADIEERKQRLLREARAAGKLLHPNVVALFDAAEADGLLYLAFEYVAGVDLAKRAASAPPMTLRQVLTAALEVATALDFAHQHHIVHRDIKPSNILLGPSGEAKVADFGIAKLNDSTELTRTGSVVGSPQYMSPEQVRGEALDGRSDLFSLGVVLYEMVCRLRPFGGDTLSTLVFEILAKEPPTVDQMRPGLPPQLVSLIHRMLCKDRDQRPASAREVVAELQQIVASTAPIELDSPASPTGPSEGATVRMPSSADVAMPPPPPPPPTSVAAQIPSGSQGYPPPGSPPTPRRTATMTPYPAADQAPTSPSMQAAAATPPGPSHSEPPPPPPAAPPLTTRAPLATPAPGSVAAEQAERRPSPLETGTYSGPTPRRMMLAVVALLVAIAVGFGASSWLSGTKEPVTEGGGASASSASQPSASPEQPSTEPRTAEPRTAEPRTAEPDSELASTGDADTGDVSGETGPGEAELGTPRGESSLPPSDSTVGQQTSPPTSVPSRTAPSRTAAPEPTRTEPSPPPPIRTEPSPPPPPRPSASPSQQTPPATVPPATQSPPAASSDEIPPPASTASPRELKFDAAAKAARQELNTGRRLRFAVKPEDTVVKIQARGERSIVQGQVLDFEAGEKDARDLELPGDGDFLVTLVHASYPDLVLFVHADATRGSAPHTVRLSMASAARSSGKNGGPEVVRASRGVWFSGSPAAAKVIVDGEQRGRASRWPGGRGLSRARNSLKLDRGRHIVRLEAPGFEPLEIQVIIDSSADLRFTEVIYRLRPSS